MAKILVVDDDADMRNLVYTALTRDGHQVDREENSTQLSPACCRQYDLLLLDVMMPGEDGFSSVQTDSPGSGLPHFIFNGKDRGNCSGTGVWPGRR